MRKLAIAAAIGLVMTGAAYAEESGRGGRNRERGQGQGIEMMTGKIAQKLELDSATSAKLTAIMKAQMEARKTAAQNLKTEMQALKKLVKENASAADISASLDKIEALKRSTNEGQLKTAAEIRALLGPQKAAQLLIMQDQMMGKMRERIRENSRGNRGRD